MWDQLEALLGEGRDRGEGGEEDTAITAHHIKVSTMCYRGVQCPPQRLQEEAVQRVLESGEDTGEDTQYRQLGREGEGREDTVHQEDEEEGEVSPTSDDIKVGFRLHTIGDM